MQDQGKLDKAELLYSSILVSHPRNFEPLHRPGTLYFRAARHAEAWRCLSGAVEVRPTDPVALANLARLQANLGLRNDALANFERAIAAKPEFAEAQFAAYARERDAGASGSLRRIETRRTPRMYKEREPLPEILWSSCDLRALSV